MGFKYASEVQSTYFLPVFPFTCRILEKIKTEVMAGTLHEGLCKIQLFDLLSRCEHFVEMHRGKLCVSTKFLHLEIRCNFGIFRRVKTKTMDILQSKKT